MTMKILGPSGQPIGTTAAPIDEQALSAQQPKEHEPRWYRRRVEECDQLFGEMYQAALQDMNHPKTPGVAVDREAIVRHYQHEWAKHCHKVLNSPQPVPLNVAAMREELEKTVKLAEHKARMNTPIHQLNDLTEWDFKLVGRCTAGTVWLNSHCWLVVGDGGVIKVYLTDRATPAGRSPNYLLEALDDMGPDLEHVGLTMQQVYNLLGAYQVTSTAAPTEEEVALARGNTTNTPTA